MSLRRSLPQPARLRRGRAGSRRALSASAVRHGRVLASGGGRVGPWCSRGSRPRHRRDLCDAGWARPPSAPRPPGSCGHPPRQPEGFGADRGRDPSGGSRAHGGARSGPGAIGPARAGGRRPPRARGADRHRPGGVRRAGDTGGAASGRRRLHRSPARRQGGCRGARELRAVVGAQPAVVARDSRLRRRFVHAALDGPGHRQRRRPTPRGDIEYGAAHRWTVRSPAATPSPRANRPDGVGDAYTGGPGRGRAMSSMDGFPPRAVFSKRGPTTASPARGPQGSSGSTLTEKQRPHSRIRGTATPGVKGGPPPCGARSVQGRWPGRAGRMTTAFPPGIGKAATVGWSGAARRTAGTR